MCTLLRLLRPATKVPASTYETLVMTTALEQYRSLRNEVAAVWLPRQIIEVSGPDAGSFLQGQLSQDIDELEVGAGVWSFVLQPHGKVDAFVAVTRSDLTVFHLDVDGGHGEHLLERLARFKLRTKIDLELLDWKVLGLRGPESHDIGEKSGSRVLWADWRDFKGVDLIGPSIDVPEGIELVDPEVYEAVRIEEGIPVLGRELDERTIPAEAGVNDLAISFTKGCYTGQELVARIDSRGGNVSRHLRGVVLESSVEPPPTGAKVIATVGNLGAPSKVVGTMTSSTYSPGLDSAVGLALVRRDVRPPVDAVLEWDEETAPCQVRSLPLKP